MTNVDTKSKKGMPKYLHIYEDIHRQIQNGTLKPGDRLPSFSELRTSYDAMPATVDRTYARLERENLVVREARRGVFVAPRELAQTGTIGLLLRSVYRTPPHDSAYVQHVLDGILEASRELEMKITLIEDNCNVHYHQVDGILLCCDKWEAYAMGIPEQLPQVILFQHTNDITSVTADDFGGARMATSHLIAQGHRRIACLMEENLDIPIQRRAGYHAALLDAGIEALPQWMRLTEKTSPSKSLYYLEWGRQQMRAWLNEGWLDLQCTAIVAQNDLSAIGIVQVLQEAGIDVPGKVSVIGFDGTPICDVTSPRLTSIQVPLFDIGKEAVKVLCDQIKNGPQTPREISLPVKLRAGDSVAQIELKGE